MGRVGFEVVELMIWKEVEKGEDVELVEEEIENEGVEEVLEFVFVLHDQSGLPGVLTARLKIS